MHLLIIVIKVRSEFSSPRKINQEISVLCKYFYRLRMRIHCMFRQFFQSLFSLSFCRKLFLSFVTALQKFDYLYKDPGCPRILLTQDTVGAATEPVLIVTEAIAACQVFFKPSRRVCTDIDLLEWRPAMVVSHKL